MPRAAASHCSDKQDLLPARVFRAGALYRRCCLYLAAGGALVVALLPVLPRPGNAPLPFENLVGAILVGVVAPLMAWAYLTIWRLRIDERGFSRRRLGIWTCWPWDLLASDQVTFDKHHGILWTNVRPWWDRMLGIAVVEPADLPYIYDVIDGLARPVAVQANEEAISLSRAQSVTIRSLLGHQLKVTAVGVEVGSGKRTTSYLWNEITEFCLTREPVKHAVATRIELACKSGKRVKHDVTFLRIDDQRVGKPHVERPAWLASLKHLVPALQWRCYRTWGGLESFDEGVFRLRHFSKRHTIFAWMKWLAAPVALVFASLIFVPKLIDMWNDPFLVGPWKPIALVCAGLTMVIQPLLLWLIAHTGQQGFQKRIVETKAELETLVREETHLDAA